MNVIRQFDDRIEAVSDHLDVVPTDVWLICGFLFVVQSVWLLPPGSALRFVLVVPLFLFMPGYTATTVLFPAKSGLGGETAEWLPTLPRIDGVERAALSFGLSVAMLPFFALVFTLTTGGIRGPIVAVVSGVVFVLMLFGWWRRSKLADDQRFTISLRGAGRTVRAGTVESSRLDAGINIFLGICVIAAVGVFAFGLAAPQQGASYTEVSLGTETDGEFLTSGYKTEFQQGENAEYALLVENNEGRAVTYNVVVQLERDTETITDTTELDRLTIEAAPGETAVETHTVAPPVTGDSLRLTYLLYLEEPPESPDRESAYRSVHVWIDVEG